ncbi:type II secretion system ATPase GspE [Viridibacterium curvum]|uniref:Type II secretion system protein E n=1 Tax=Viridibacterium curvum TaxID=1101404 RepID=A0ABP9QCW8_9RHOO
MDSLPYAFARTHGVLLLAAEEDSASILAREDVAPAALVELRRMLGLPLKLERVAKNVFEARLAESYQQGTQDAAAVVDDLGQDVDVSRLMEEIPVVEDLLETQEDAPIIRMINALLQQAIRERASDIHIEPFERYCVVRYRRDGTLLEIARPHRALHAALVSRIKVMAELDIAEKRLPQDGRIGLRIAGRAIDVRVSTLPTQHGERIVLRLLDKTSNNFGLDSTGMEVETLTAFRRLLAQPHGIVLVTGPTGSGKSTTLYGALREISSSTRNIVTVEDPIEYDLPGVGQIQVNTRIELSFARALRAILRQDPDVIMIGEIRDLETAQIAVQASLTGHLVLATLHTNDATSAITRLIDMGIEPFLLASSLRGVVAQRLVRKLCPECRTPRASTPVDYEFLNVGPGKTLFASKGCPSCSNTGYAGRTGIYELLEVNPVIGAMIHDNQPENEIRDTALNYGLKLLRNDGCRLLESGITSPEELLRVTRE